MPLLKKVLAEADGASLLRALESQGAVSLELEGESLELGPEEIAVSLEARPGFAAAAADVGVVVLHTELSPEIMRTGANRCSGAAHFAK